MADAMKQQITYGLNQYKLEVQNQELQAQIIQANHIIEMQNQHIEHIFTSMNVLIGIMGLFVAIFGVIIPLWNAWKSAQMKKDVENAVKDANLFITNKFQEWESAEIENALKRYKNNEISWQALQGIIKYKPLTYEQLLDIYNTAIIVDNQGMVECLTQYIFKEHFNDKSDGYNKIRSLVANSKFFPLFAYKLTEGIVNALLFVSDKKRENIINQAIDTSVTSFLAYNHINEKIPLSSNNKSHIVNKIIQEKCSSSLQILENNSEFIDMLIEKGLLEECSYNERHGYSYGTAILSLGHNSYLKQKLNNHLTNEIVKRADCSP